MLFSKESKTLVLFFSMTKNRLYWSEESNHEHYDPSAQVYLNIVSLGVIVNA